MSQTCQTTFHFCSGNSFTSADVETNIIDMWTWVYLCITKSLLTEATSLQNFVNPRSLQNQRCTHFYQVLKTQCGNYESSQENSSPSVVPLENLVTVFRLAHVAADAVYEDVQFMVGVGILVQETIVSNATDTSFFPLKIIRNKQQCVGELQKKLPTLKKNFCQNS